MEINKEKYNILVVEDDDLMQQMLKDTLIKEGYKVVIASDGMEGWDEFRKSDFDLALLDIKLPKIDGISLLKKIKNTPAGIETIVIMMTAYGVVETAVDAMKLGAYDYITKPFLSEELVLLVHKGLELQSIKKENVLLCRELDKRYSLGNLIGKSRKIQEIYDLIEIIASSNATVLIQGESGTGKELVAQTIHHLSPRKNKPLVKVSCASLPETLLESELFGYEKGAFTDAVSRKMGRFELAHQGTIFLDDIDDMSPMVQVKLLRVLQEREFERVGGTETIKIDVRVVSASKANLQEKATKGAFREDLFYRLNVVPMLLPNLRERKEDIPLLAKHFLDKFNQEMNKQVTISPGVLQSMINYDWPGNIRELENLVERLVTVSVRNEILTRDLPAYLNEDKKWAPAALHKVVEETQREHIIKVLESAKWNRKQSAKILGITPKTLWQKMKRYAIE